MPRLSPEVLASLRRTLNASETPAEELVQCGNYYEGGRGRFVCALTGTECKGKNLPLCATEGVTVVTREECMLALQRITGARGTVRRSGNDKYFAARRNNPINRPTERIVESNDI